MTEMQDSGQRQQFDTGAVRDTAEGKPRMGLISPFAMRRLGAWLTKGAEKYEDRNWEKGIPFGRVIASLERHVQGYKAGENDEDHLAAIMCNTMFIMHYEEMIKRGVLPAELNDMPDYGSEKEEDVGGENDCNSQPDVYTCKAVCWPAGVYRKKGEGFVTAIQWDGKNTQAVQNFFRRQCPPEEPLSIREISCEGGVFLAVNTLFGGEYVKPGDWVVHGPGDALYSFSDEAFKKRFDLSSQGDLSF